EVLGGEDLLDARLGGLARGDVHRHGEGRGEEGHVADHRKQEDPPQAGREELAVLAQQGRAHAPPPGVGVPAWTEVVRPRKTCSRPGLCSVSSCSSRRAAKARAPTSCAVTPSSSTRPGTWAVRTCQPCSATSRASASASGEATTTAGFAS